MSAKRIPTQTTGSLKKPDYKSNLQSNSKINTQGSGPQSESTSTLINRTFPYPGTRKRLPAFPLIVFGSERAKFAHATPSKLVSFIPLSPRNEFDRESKHRGGHSIRLRFGKARFSKARSRDVIRDRARVICSPFSFAD